VSQRKERSVRQTESKERMKELEGACEEEAMREIIIIKKG
jgi:hypothetical protein